MGCGSRVFGRRSSRPNFSYFSSLCDGLALLHLCGCGFDNSPTFRDKPPSGRHGLLLWRELGRLFDLRLRRRMAFRPLGLWTGSTSSLSVSGPALLPLTATAIVCIVVGIAISAPLLFIYNSAHSVRNVWATTGHAHPGITAITLRVTEALARFALYRSLASLIRFNYHSETTERRSVVHLADKRPACYRHYDVQSCNTD